MTEEQIERIVERKMDALDRRLLRTALSQAEYDDMVRAVYEWAEAEYRWARTQRLQSALD